MTRKPTTLHEHFRADPRGASSYTQWIEDRIWELLQRPATIQYQMHDWKSLGSPIKWSALHKALAALNRDVSAPMVAKMRVVILDGTIIKEWPAKNS